jgi:predicted nucleic acid-binding Zn ribbon protein
LIENENEGLKNNYRAYLQRLERSGLMPDIEQDRRYVDLVKRLEKAQYTRSRCITALQSLKRAHNKVAVELAKRQNMNYLIDELLELNTLALYLQTQLP